MKHLQIIAICWQSQEFQVGSYHEPFNTTKVFKMRISPRFHLKELKL